MAPGSARQRTLAACLSLMLAALAAGIVFSRTRPDSYDADIMLQVANSMVNHHSLHVQHDLFGFNHPYASYAIGMSLLFAAGVAVANLLHQDPASLAMLVNPVIFALTVGALFWVARLLGGTPRQAAVTAMLTGFGTLLVSFTSTGFSEPGVALGVALSLVAVAARRRTWAALLGGAGAGLALLMREDSLVLVVPWVAVAVLWSGEHKVRSAVRFAIGLLPAVVVTLVYNAYRFGAFWHAGYPGQPFNHPIALGVYGLLLSPAAGVLVYVPLVAVAAAGMPAAWRRCAPLVALAIVLLLVRIPFYAAWWTWSGEVSYGPRFLVPALPVLAVGILEVVTGFRRRAGPLKVAVVALAAASTLIAVVGAAVRPEANSLLAAVAQRARPHVPLSQFIRVQTTVAAELQLDSYWFDWRLYPPVNELEMLAHGEHLTSRFLNPRVDGVDVAVLSACTLACAATALIVSPSRTRSRAG